MIWYPALLVGIAAASYGVAAWYRDQRGGWTGERRTTESGKQYYWYVKTNKNQPIGSWFGITAPCAFDFTLEPEGWFHRLTKQFGFCTELQTGDSEFDRRIYIRSDARLFQRKLSNDSELHALILKAFSLGAASLYSTPNLLTIKLKNPSSSLYDHTADLLVDILTGIKRRLADISADAQSVPPALQKLEAAFMALPAFMFTGAIASQLASAVLNYQIVDYGALPAMAVKLGIELTVLFLILIRLFFHHSAYGHVVLRNFLLFGVISTFFACFSVPTFVNCGFDTSATGVHVEPVQGKYVTHGSKGRVYYHIQVADWDVPSQAASFEVDSTLYDNVQAGIRVKIVAHPGLFRMEWIDPVETLDR